jgi:hypothetical protein
MHEGSSYIVAEHRAAHHGIRPIDERSLAAARFAIDPDVHARAGDARVFDAHQPVAAR